MNADTHAEMLESAVELTEDLASRSGKVMAARDSEATVKILDGLASGKTQAGVSRELGVRRATVNKLARENKEWLTEWRARMLSDVADQAAKVHELNRRKLDEMLEDQEKLDKTSLKDLAVTQAIYLDKFERLAGAPDVKVEVEHRFGLSDAKEWLAKAREVSGRVVDAEEALGAPEGRPEAIEGPLSDS